MHLPFKPNYVEEHTVQLGSHSPNNAIRREVFPDPVGPITKLIFPFLNLSSSSIFSVKLRPEGVCEPLEVFDHVNVALRKPMSSEGASASLTNN